MFNYQIVGAGFSGSVLAERLASIGKKVLLIDKEITLRGMLTIILIMTVFSYINMALIFFIPIPKKYLIIEVYGMAPVT